MEMKNIIHFKITFFTELLSSIHVYYITQTTFFKEKKNERKQKFNMSVFKRYADS